MSISSTSWDPMSVLIRSPSPPPQTVFDMLEEIKNFTEDGNLDEAYRIYLLIPDSEPQKRESFDEFVGRYIIFGGDFTRAAYLTLQENRRRPPVIRCPTFFHIAARLLIRERVDRATEIARSIPDPHIASLALLAIACYYAQRGPTSNRQSKSDWVVDQIPNHAIRDNCRANVRWRALWHPTIPPDPIDNLAANLDEGQIS